MNHFVAMEMSRRTVHSVLRRFQEDKTVERKKESEKVAEKLPPASRRRLVKAACDKKRVSERKLAEKFNISLPYMAKVLKQEGVKHYKKQTCPKSTPELKQRQIKCL